VSGPASDPLRRRAVLRLRDNARERIDFVVTLATPLPVPVGPAAADPSARLTLRYVPDREILEPACLDDYLAQLAAEDWAGPEDLAATLFDDVNNQLVPRWLHLALTAGAVRIDLHDRQPEWDNPGLLSMLPRV